jgi:hypothetical protein
MKTGMLWFDNDPHTDMTKKLTRAATYYQNKYGQQPNVCFVHPSMIKDAPPKNNGIELRSSRSVLPNHFWLGVQIVA